MHKPTAIELQDAPLPPGHDVVPTSRARLGRFDLMSKLDQYGPVFCIQRKGRLTVYVVGLARGRKLLKEHADDLNTSSMDLSAMFPNGFMRMLTGDLHATLRSNLSRALRSELLIHTCGELTCIVEDALDGYRNLESDRSNQSKYFLESLNSMATNMLIRLFFSDSTSSRLHQSLKQGFDLLGPEGLVWTPGADQEVAFANIRDMLLQKIDSHSVTKVSKSCDCVIDEIAAQGELSETMIGNLIYMVEMGRFDIYSLFRWIAKYGCDHPHALDAIAITGRRYGPLENVNAESFVKENLRMDQSEKLIRQSVRDFEFEGYRIPGNTAVQICLWESHKDPVSFANPLEFDPDRFLDTRYTQDQYSPFGLGMHHCPMDRYSIALGKIFIATLAAKYRMSGIENGNPVHGLYHWQPSMNFSVRLDPRQHGESWT